MEQIDKIVEDLQDIFSEYSFVEERDGAPYISHESGYAEALQKYVSNLLQPKKEERTTLVGEERTNKYGDQMYFTGRIEIPNFEEWYMDDQDMIIKCNHPMTTLHEIYSLKKS
jgi:hypothetical protein